MKRQLSSLFAGAMLVFLVSPVVAAPPPDDYAAPFGIVGTASTTNPPPFTTGTPPADTTNEVIITPTGPVLAPPSPPATPPTSPPMPDTGSETYKKTYELCQQMIPAVRDGFYEYINNDPVNVNGPSVNFVIAGATGVDAAVLKNCLVNGYRPPETEGHTCLSCAGLVSYMPDGFYSSTPPLMGYDWMYGYPIYDFSSTTPTWVRDCLMIGHWAPEQTTGYVPGGYFTDASGSSIYWGSTCTDYVGTTPVPANYCAPTGSVSWTVSGKTCIGGVGSAANGVNKTALSNTPGLDGFAYMYCDAGNTGNGMNGWTFDLTKTALNTCGEAKPKNDDCKPGSYTVSQSQTLKSGAVVTNYCKASFPTGRDTELIPMTFPHTYWTPPVDAWSSGSGDFVCDKNQTTNGVGGWIAQANFKCERPDP
jgi:hypothetical protein